MTSYAGLDRGTYPGDDDMQSLWDNTNFYWTGYYLPVPWDGHNGPHSWKGTYQRLQGMGWGVAPIYLGKQTDSAKLRQRRGREREDGALDGAEACRFADGEKIPTKSVIYFDCERKKQPPGPEWFDYFAGWVEGVDRAHYLPGLYASYQLVPNIFGGLLLRTPLLALRLEVWAVRWPQQPGQPYTKKEFPTDDPGDSGFGRASSWQKTGNSLIRWDHPRPGGSHVTKTLTPVDLNTSRYMDPGRQV